MTHSSVNTNRIVENTHTCLLSGEEALIILFYWSLQQWRTREQTFLHFISFRGSVKCV
jgi:hypothetical protein